MADLLTTGLTVIPLPGLDPHTGVHRLLLDIRELHDRGRAVADLAYPITPEHPAQIVLGGFGAAGLPSLSHSPAIRALRVAVYQRVAPELAAIHPGRHLELLFDRFSIRRMGTATSAESWHRDVGGKDPGDIIYGGWLNLDPPGSPPQRFSCVPGNVLPPDVDSRGFAKIPKAEHPELNAALKAAGGPIAVPPGHIILFDQTIAHKITGATAGFTSYRLYFGWRITDSRTPLYPKDGIIEKQLVPPLPSGEISPTYAKLHWVNWRDRLLEFSTGFKPEFLDPNPKRAGCVARVLPGLVATGHAFSPYTTAERAIFYPQPLVPPVPVQSSPPEPPAKRARLA